jgi:O-antigen/teichoic acid export membrane protein
VLKKFFKDSAIYTVAGFISRGISIFLVPFYTRIFTPSDYGIIDILAIAGSIISHTVGFEITQAVARFYPDSKNEDDKRTIASNSFWFTLFFYSLFLLVCLSFSGYFTQLLLDGLVSKRIFQIWAMNSFFTGMFYLFQNQLKWRLESRKFASVSILYTLVTIPSTILLVLVFRFDLYGVFLAKSIGGVVGALVAFYFARSDYKFIFNFTKLFEMLKYSIPLVPSGVGVFFLNSSHKILIKSMMSLSDLGLFGVGTRLTSMVTVLLQSMQGSLTPLIISKYREPETPGEIARLFRYVVFLALIAFLTISVYAREVLIILTTPAYVSAYKLVPLLLLDKIFFSIHVFAPGLNIAKKTKLLATITVLSSLVNLLISYAGIKYFGLVGGAFGTMLSSVTMFTLILYYSQKNYRVPYDSGRIITGLIIVSVLVGLSFHFFADEHYNIMQVIVIKALIIIIGIFALMMIKLISLQELKRLFGMLSFGQKKIK